VIKKRNIMRRNKQKNKPLGKSIFPGFDVVQVGSSIQPPPIEFLNSVHKVAADDPSYKSLTYAINRDLEKLDKENKQTTLQKLRQKAHT